MSAAHLRHRPRLFEAPGLFVPITTGVVNPAILLPTDWRQWHAAKLDAVLVHEPHTWRAGTRWSSDCRCSTARSTGSVRSAGGCTATWWRSAIAPAMRPCSRRASIARIRADTARILRRDPRRSSPRRLARRDGQWSTAERRFNRILRWKERRVSHFTTFATIVIVGALTPVAGLAATASATLVRTELSMLPAPPPRALVASVPTALKFIGAPAASADDTSQEASPIETATQSAPSQPTGASTQPGYVGPPARNDLADRQMVDFVFDLRTLPGEDLKRAADDCVGLRGPDVDQGRCRTERLSRCGRARTFCESVKQSRTSRGTRSGSRTPSPRWVRAREAPAARARPDSRTSRRCVTAWRSARRPMLSKAPIFLRHSCASSTARPSCISATARSAPSTRRPTSTTSPARAPAPNVSFFSITGATFFDPLPPPGVIPVGVSL